jgi:early secretory antigenic target protein ESAT-6
MSYISVNYHQMDEAVGRMQTIARRMDGRLADLKAKLQRMSWEGGDREAYRAYQRQWDSSAADLNVLLEDIARRVAEARQGYKGGEDTIVKLWS